MSSSARRERRREVEVDVGRRLVRVNVEPITLSLRNARKSARDTPPFSASTVISAMHCATTPSIRLWQIFTSRAQLALADVGHAASRAARGSGRACSHASRGPDATIVSRPLADDLRVAADRRRQHRGAARARRPRGSSAATVGEIVVESTITRGATSVARQQPVGAADDLLDVRRAGDHREHDVPVGEIGRRVDDRRAELGERLGLRRVRL